MTLAAPSLILALLAPGGAVATVKPSVAVTGAAPAEPAAALRIPSFGASEPSAQLDVRANPLVAPRWAFDAKRPAALPAMYAGFGALQALDIYSTRRAIAGGATEMNPLLAPGVKSAAGMAAVKAASTALSIYFVERTWKRNRKGAVVLMGVLNGVTAAVVARNLQNAR
jgi:hypothetical protein